MQNGKCICTTNGWPIGDLPGAHAVLALQLQRVVSLKLPVTITLYGDVPKKLMVGVVDSCMKAKVAEISFTNIVRRVRWKI